MDKAIQVGFILLVGFVGVYTQAEIMSALQEVALSGVDPDMPLSQLMVIVVKSIFNPVTGLLGLVAACVVGLKTVLQN